MYALGALLMRPISRNDPADITKHGRTASLVQATPDLHKALQEANTPSKHEVIGRQIGATDHQADTLVCDPYGLARADLAVGRGTTEAAVRP